MIAYIFKSSLGLIIFFGLYWILLRDIKILAFNRVFLILSILLSLVIPLISVPLIINSNQNIDNVANFLSSLSPKINQQVDPSITTLTIPEDQTYIAEINFSKILITIYLLGLMLFLIRFIRNIYGLFHLINISEKVKYADHEIVLINKPINPFSFFNYICIYKLDYHNNSIENDLLKHEKAHINQFHMVDVLFIELILILYWFNPILLLFKKAIRLNHEFLADDNVITNSTDSKSYAERLLRFIDYKSNIQLSTGFYNSLTKKRLIMMSKPRSKNLNVGLRISILFLLSVSFLLIISWIQPNSLISPDFSGKWVLNKDKSAQFLKEGNVSFALDISQKGINMNIQKIFDFTDREPLKRLDYYKLDSKGIITETDKMIQTVTAGWSPDGQSFLVTTQINYKADSSKNSKRIETYSLSNDQKTLIINYNDILPESSKTPFQERIFNMIYDKSNL